MSRLPDERPAKALCPAIPRLGHQGRALLHPPGGPTKRPEETCNHGLQDGGQVGCEGRIFNTAPAVTSAVLCCGKIYSFNLYTTI